MTTERDGLVKRLRARADYIASYASYANGEGRDQFTSDLLREAADALSAARCELCSIDDGLVREWVSKARSVARSKGLLSERSPR